MFFFCNILDKSRKNGCSVLRCLMVKLEMRVLHAACIKCKKFMLCKKWTKILTQLVIQPVAQHHSNACHIYPASLA